MIFFVSYYIYTMCAKFSQQFNDLKKLMALVGDFQLPSDFHPGEFYFPRNPILAVKEEAGMRAAGIYQWGLVPHWAKDPDIGAKTFNARAETLSELPSFREAYKKRRCVIPAMGFYEWKKEKDRKVSVYISHKFQEPLCFAGLYEHWTSKEGEYIQSATIITTGPNDFMKPIHHRMPVILPIKNDISIWLNPDIQDKGVLQQLLIPLREDILVYDKQE